MSYVSTKLSTIVATKRESHTFSNFPTVSTTSIAAYFASFDKAFNKTFFSAECNSYWATFLYTFKCTYSYYYYCAKWTTDISTK